MSVAGGQPSMADDLPLIGQDRARADLAAALDTVARGRGVAVVISGDPGAGKSRLMQEAATLARSRGFRVLTATGSPLHRSLHYAVLIDVLRPLVHLGPQGARTALVDGLPGLGVLFDDIGEPTGDTLGDAGLDRTRLFESIRRLLGRAARRQPLLIALDDTHWADPASLAALAYTAGGADQEPVLFAVARRSAEPEPTDAEFVAAVRRLPRTVPIELARLGPGPMAEFISHLLGGPPPQALVDLVAERTSGLPFFVRAVVDQLMTDHRLSRLGGHWVMDNVERLVVPDRIGDVLGGRLGQLPPAQREVIDLVAVSGGEIAHPVLVAATDVDPLPAVRQLLGAGLLVETLHVTTVSYRALHPLLTEVAVARLPEVARRRLHARLAAAIEADEAGDPSRLGRLAHHLTGAGDQVDPHHTLDVLRRAVGEALASHAGTAAARHADSALAIARRLGADDLVPELLDHRARGLSLAGSASALQAWAEAAQGWRGRGATFQWAGAKATMARAKWDRGLFAEAVADTDEAIDVLAGWPGSDAALTAHGLRILFLARLMSPRLKQAVQDLDVDARAAPSPWASALVCFGRAHVASIAGDQLSAREHARQGLAHAEATGNPILVESALRALAPMTAQCGDVDETARLCARGIAVARQIGVPTLEDIYRVELCFVHAQSGRMDQADEAIHELLDLGHRTGSERMTCYGLVMQGIVAVFRGDLPAASDSLRAVGEVYGGGHPDDTHVRGAVDALAEIIARARERPNPGTAAGRRFEYLSGGYAMVSAAAGQPLVIPRDTVELATLGRGLSSPGRGPWSRAVGVRLAALSAILAGEPEAVPLLRQAAESLERLGLRFSAAEAWVEWACLSTEVDDAVAVLQREFGFLERIGALPLAAKAGARLRELGVRPTASRTHVPARAAGPLSRREAEIAGLVADGLSNPEIAARLYISPRTVTTHLQHIYERLGLASRTALARWVVEGAAAVGRSTDGPAAHAARNT